MILFSLLKKLSINLEVNNMRANMRSVVNKLCLKKISGFLQKNKTVLSEENKLLILRDLRTYLNSKKIYFKFNLNKWFDLKLRTEKKSVQCK
jgi:hypothetical protein